MNFALIASLVFGRKGYVLASGLLLTLLLGWYAVQTGITGALVARTYGLNYVLMTILAGVLYIAITFIGVKGLHWIGTVSVPLFLVLGLWVAAMPPRPQRLRRSGPTPATTASRPCRWVSA